MKRPVYHTALDWFTSLNVSIYILLIFPFKILWNISCCNMGISHVLLLGICLTYSYFCCLFAMKFYLGITSRLVVFLFQTFSQRHYEKRLYQLRYICPFVLCPLLCLLPSIIPLFCPFVRKYSPSTGQIFLKFILVIALKICGQILSSSKS